MARAQSVDVASRASSSARPAPAGRSITLSSITSRASSASSAGTRRWKSSPILSTPDSARPGTDGQLLWGWADSDLARWNDALEIRRDHTVPFSVATERLAAIAHGIDVTVSVARHPDAEAALARVREDLRLLRVLTPERSDRHIERGLSAAWHHLSTLTSLACEPSRFDRFAGLPPWAARATSTFEPELTAWARTLDGDRAEIATILASDISDLRAALDCGNPLGSALAELARDRTVALVVTKTKTSSRALLDALGADPDAGAVGALSMCAVGRLHRQGPGRVPSSSANRRRGTGIASCRACPPM